MLVFDYCSLIFFGVVLMVKICFMLGILRIFFVLNDLSFCLKIGGWVIMVMCMFFFCIFSLKSGLLVMILWVFIFLWLVLIILKFLGFFSFIFLGIFRVVVVVVMVL